MENGTAQISHLFVTLKRELKARNLAYRDIAHALETSEASVKRWFSLRRVSLEQLAAIADLLGLTLAELMQEAASHEPPLRSLTLDQEKAVMADTRLLLVAACVLNHWTLADIVAKYDVSETQCIRYLVTLDRLRLIDFLPQNRVRLRVARDFAWLENGPISRFFQQQGLHDFLESSFHAPYETSAFTHAMLTPAANAQFQSQLKRLRKSFADLHEESLAAPLSERHGVGFFFALREWEPQEFAALKREKPA
ncbi:MAG: helix-turn-helix transcriptional regulator [Burkholderiales bacterium]|jgi:transcriptional regulator with XRE-family HTH domain|nr:helix-turn-helix transcriptional regulator [Burkholderiales bacterium]